MVFTALVRGLTAASAVFVLLFIRIITSLLWGIPRVAYCHALNDEVRRKLRIII